jgi:Arc/MetJ-type ribon-helix-helix transcriptional regulator
MTIILSPEVGKLVQDRVRCGDYDSPDALVGAAVRRLIEEDREEDSHREAVRTRVEAAEAEIDRGEYVEYDGETVHGLAEDVWERGLKRLGAQPEKTGTLG